MTQTDVGTDVSGRVIVLSDLQNDLVAGGVSVPRGLTVIAPPQEFDPNKVPPVPGALPPPYPDGARLFTYDDQWQPSDLPPEAGPIVAAYTPGVTT